MTVSELVFNENNQFRLPIFQSEYRSVADTKGTLEEWKKEVGFDSKIRIEKGINYLEVYILNWEEANNEIKEADDNMALRF